MPSSITPPPDSTSGPGRRVAWKRANGRKKIHPQLPPGYAGPNLLTMGTGQDGSSASRDSRLRPILDGVAVGAARSCGGVGASFAAAANAAIGNRGAIQEAIVINDDSPEVVEVDLPNEGRCVVLPRAPAVASAWQIMDLGEEESPAAICHKT